MSIAKIVKATRGDWSHQNNYDYDVGCNVSRIKYKICLEDATGKRYFYEYNSDDDSEVVWRISEPAEMKDVEEVPYHLIDEAVLRKHFSVMCPDGSQEEENRFIYGEEEGQRINDDNVWAEAHKVFSTEITKCLRERLGYFEKVRLVSEEEMGISRRKTHTYLLDDRWMVHVVEEHNEWRRIKADFFINDLQAILKPEGTKCIVTRKTGRRPK